MSSNSSQTTVAAGAEIGEEWSTGRQALHKLHFHVRVVILDCSALPRRVFLTFLCQLEKNQCLIWERQILKYFTNGSLSYLSNIYTLFFFNFVFSILASYEVNYFYSMCVFFLTICILCFLQNFTGTCAFFLRTSDKVITASNISQVRQNHAVFRVHLRFS